MLKTKPTVWDARAFAEKAHGSQVWGEGKPYVAHLDEVQGVLVRYGITNEAMHMAAFLHDVLEDTDVCPKEINDRFGLPVLVLVKAVTNEPGANRRERHEKTYPKIKEIPQAVWLKLADRIANVEQCIATKSKLGNMYAKEYTDFKSALYDPNDLVAEPMWAWLDHLIGQIPPR